MEIVRTIISPEGNRKVKVFRRPDGSFGFEEWHWQTEEGCWCPFGKYSVSFTDSLEGALQEIRGRIAWIKDAEQ